MTLPINFYVFREFYIPRRMRIPILNYIHNRVQPGDFLEAVITNNLSGACARADDENLKNLPAYVAYFHNEAPSQCWGSTQKMDAWLSEGGNHQHTEE